VNFLNVVFGRNPADFVQYSLLICQLASASVFETFVLEQGHT
jgi:hypothetical protein